MIWTTCRCGLRLSTDDDNAGRQVACPGCGGLVEFDPAGETPAPSSTRDESGPVVRLPPIEAEDLCPRCGSHDTVTGRFRVITSMASGGRFVPDGLGLLARCFQSLPGVAFKSTCRSCLACGLIWTDLDPAALRSHLQKHGDAATRARWASPEPKKPPEPDLA